MNVKYHYVRNQVTNPETGKPGPLVVCYVKTSENITDILTKRLNTSQHTSLTYEFLSSRKETLIIGYKDNDPESSDENT